MPAAVFGNTFLLDWMQTLCQNVSSGYGRAQRLFVNDYVPVPEMTWGSFVECTLSGYSWVNLGLLDWTYFATGGVGQAVAPPIVYNFPSYAGPLVTLYGVYWTGYSTSTETVVLAQRFETPFTVPLAGGPFPTYPFLTDRRYVAP